MNFGRETPGRAHLAAENRTAAHLLRVAIHNAEESRDLAGLRTLAQRVAEHIATCHRYVDQVQALLPVAVPDDEDDVLPDYEKERRTQDLHADLVAIRAGIEPETGLTTGSLDKLRGLPGLDELEGMADRIASRITALEVRENTTWPRPYRYIGPRFQHYLGTRYAKPGEVIDLDERQAEAFAERFEPVEQEATSTS